MPKVTDIKRAPDGVTWGETLLTPAQAEQVRKKSDGICGRCQQAVDLSPESDLYLLEGELHHYPECVRAAQAALDIPVGGTPEP
jgi:hypothetical protein